MNRPRDACCRSQPTLASTMGLRAKAIEMDVAGSSKGQSQGQGAKAESTTKPQQQPVAAQSARAS